MNCLHLKSIELRVRMVGFHSKGHKHWYTLILHCNQCLFFLKSYFKNSLGCTDSRENSRYPSPSCPQCCHLTFPSSTVKTRQTRGAVHEPRKPPQEGFPDFHAHSFLPVQLLFKKLSFVRFWCWYQKTTYKVLRKGDEKNSFLFQLGVCRGLSFLTTQPIQESECRLQVSSRKSDATEICENIKHSVFLFWNYLFFLKMVY